MARERDMQVNLPFGFALVNFFFGGTGLPTGAAVSFGLGGAGDPNTPSGLASELIGYWDARIKPVTTNGATLTGCRVKFGPMDSGPFALVGANITGTATGSSVSPAVAYLVKKNSALGGKSGAGRMYHPGISDTAVSDAGVISAGVVTSTQAGWNNFMADLAASTLEMVLLHTYGTYVNAAGDTVTVPAKDPTPVLSLSVLPTVGTQRRRQRR